MSKVQKSRLGRGLSSLLSLSEAPIELELPPPESAPADAGGVDAASRRAVATLDTPSPVAMPVVVEPVSGRPLEIPIDDIEANPRQPRHTFDDTKVAELAASVRSSGIIQPIIVRRHGERFQLVAGERRWRAARMAGLASVPAIVRDVSGIEQAQMALIENIQREDLNPIDRARSYRTLIDELGLTQAELASRIGEERSSVTNYLRLLDLAEPVRNLVRDGTVSVGHAKLLAGVSDILEQQRLAQLVVSQELSVRNLERVLAGDPGHTSSSPPAPSESAKSTHLADLEKSMSRQLGMRVQIRAGAKKGRGRVILHYTSLDEFDTLLTRLGVSSD